ncbi:MAG TPA: electron transfer flavoprotein subunit beta/FixA family protein [Dehalococcoidales bacterium]|nr:electron transfer flavoprotein subunit beta/FixA family protein [Dehalococcoidales bacterium]
MKNIMVCMKQVLDPEAPLSLFKIDAAAKQAVLPKATPPVLSPFDENALEAALKIKDTQPATVSVISLGKKLVRTVVKAPLAAGADQLFLLEDEIFSDFDSCLTAASLAAAIRKIGAFDLILCGIQAADTNAGQVGTGIACLLGIPCITCARKVELNGDRIRVEKIMPDGFDVIDSALPAVVTTSYEAGTLREPGVEAFMSANKKPLTVWNAQQIGMDKSRSGPAAFLKMEQTAHNIKCEMLEGAGPAEQTLQLVGKMKDAGVF